MLTYAKNTRGAVNNPDLEHDQIRFPNTNEVVVSTHEVGQRESALGVIVESNVAGGTSEQLLEKYRPDFPAGYRVWTPSR